MIKIVTKIAFLFSYVLSSIWVWLYKHAVVPMSDFCLTSALKVRNSYVMCVNSKGSDKTGLMGCLTLAHGVQRRMISVVNFFIFLRLLFFALLFAICDLVHTVEAMYGLP